MVQTDLELARSILEDRGATVVAVKDGKVLGTGFGTRLMPLFRLCRQLRAELMGAAVADRVVGRAAAFLLLSAKVAAVHGRVMSRGAQALLTSKGTESSWGELVTAIITPQGEGCPMEAMVADCADCDQAVARLESVLSRFL